MFAKLIISKRFLTSSQKRNASNLAEDVFKITVPTEVSKEFKRKIDLHYNSLSSRDFSLKEFKEKEGNLWREELRQIASLNHEFSDKLQQAKEISPFSTIINGISLDAIDQKIIPKNQADLQNQDLMKKLRPSEISIIAYSGLLGISSDDYLQDRYTGFIFATEANKDKKGSFQSSKVNLGWHNDGWSSGETMPYVVLLGVTGNNKAQTQLISYNKIVDYFIKNNKINLLQSLNEYCEVVGVNEYLPNTIKILDQETRTINFADYGNFHPKGGNPTTFIEAIEFLNKTLSKVEPSTTIINNGDLVAISNQHGLHRRVSTDTPEATDLVGKRLVARILGTKDSETNKGR